MPRGRANQPAVLPVLFIARRNLARERRWACDSRWRFIDAYESPPDVVELHQDPEIRDQVIIQYLDKARNVILQVPSNEELMVERGISQEFQQAAKLRVTERTPAAASEGEKTHGD